MDWELNCYLNSKLKCSYNHNLTNKISNNSILKINKYQQTTMQLFAHKNYTRMLGFGTGRFLSWLIVLTVFLTDTLSTVEGGKVEPGHIYAFRTIVDGQCLTANPHDYHTDVGIFLGQVSTEVCENSNNGQKWGVILWSKKESEIEGENQNQLWLYPRENGLNAITAIPYPDEPLPEKNLIEIIPFENSQETFLIKSLELNQCVLSTGKTNAITYEPCNPKIKEQLWTVNSSAEDPIEHTISDRGVLGTVKDFVMYTGKELISYMHGKPKH